MATTRHKGRRDDDMDGKFLFMRNDVEEQETGSPGRDCKICLESGQTTRTRTFVFLGIPRGRILPHS